jgi:hypothetical protein
MLFNMLFNTLLNALLNALLNVGNRHRAPAPDARVRQRCDTRAEERRTPYFSRIIRSIRRSGSAAPHRS